MSEEGIDYETIETIADDHWQWLVGLLKLVPHREGFPIEVVEYVYKTAFIHGAKHQRELSQAGLS